MSGAVLRVRDDWGRWFPAALLLAFALALALRLVALDARPMHHDEANQAVKFGMLLESGDYRYDPDDHHGPSLYYLTLPAAWLRGQHTLAQLDEWTLRAVPALFGAALILLLPWMAAGSGRVAALVAAFLVAVSPALTYYSRFYIQEMVFGFFGVGFLLALGRYGDSEDWRSRRWWALATGLFGGFAYATKETSVIVLGSAAAAWVIASLSARRWRGISLSDVAIAAGAAIVVAGLFFSSFLKYPLGPLESVLAFGTYVRRGVEPTGHVHPVFYYARLLGFSSSGGFVWTEGAVLLLASAGLVVALRRARSSFWPLYVALYAVLTSIVFSALKYKTPWNLVPFYVGIVLLAGIGAAGMWQALGSRWAKALALAALALASWHLGVENVRANLRYPADTRNPYAYAQTSSDFLRLVERVHGLAAVHGEGRSMLVKVVAGPYEQWPLPWYLRDMSRVGYWTTAAEAAPLDEAPVIVASDENAADVEAALGDRYLTEFYGLRPGALLTVFIERGLWENYLAGRR